MQKYCAYSLVIDSDIELPVYPELPPAEKVGSLPSIKIRRVDLKEDDLHKHNDNGDYLAGVAKETLLFHVIGGNTILFDPLPDADRRFVQAVLGGELMAALLRQRGLVPLHASCVSKHGQSIAFVGDSGWGKSTLAAFFAREGYALVADDILAVDLNDKYPIVHPSPPYIRLQSDVGQKFIDKYNQLPVSHSRTSKRHVVFDTSYLKKTTQLRKLYFLEPTSRNKNSVENINHRLATVKLVNHTRAKRLATNSKYTKEHLKKCSSIVNSVNLGVLNRTLSIEDIGDIKRVIEKDTSFVSE